MFCYDPLDLMDLSLSSYSTIQRYKANCDDAIFGS